MVGAEPAAVARGIPLLGSAAKALGVEGFKVVGVPGTPGGSAVVTGAKAAGEEGPETVGMVGPIAGAVGAALFGVTAKAL